jgi:hypothetical protein
MSQLHASAFLVLEATKDGYGKTSMKIAKVTQGYPALNVDQVAVKCKVSINSEVFEQGLATLIIDVPDNTTVVHAEVLEP